MIATVTPYSKQPLLADKLSKKLCNILCANIAFVENNEKFELNT